MSTELVSSVKPAWNIRQLGQLNILDITDPRIYFTLILLSCQQITNHAVKCLDRQTAYYKRVNAAEFRGLLRTPHKVFLHQHKCVGLDIYF